jgi:hypothetical protein
VAIPHEPAAARNSPPSDAPPQRVVDAVRKSLAPYPWRGLTTVTVAAMAVAAADRARGTGGQPDRVLTAARQDERVWALADVLSTDQRWRQRPASVVARCLAAALTAEEQRSLWFDLELAWLLDPPD